MEMKTHLIAGFLTVACATFGADPGDQYAAYLTDQRAKCEKLHQAWRAAGTTAEKKAIEKELSDVAVHAERAEVLDEIASGGQFLQKQIRCDAKARTEKLEVLRDFGETPRASYADHANWVCRRITKNTFELWHPRHGWLFDRAGKVLNEARPPRRDGTGREWYGAFLPDGRWVTTDLWEYDRTLTFFSRSGKWVKEIRSEKLIDAEYSNDLIGWCRADRDGKGWVVSVGSNGGVGEVWIAPQGPSRRLQTGGPWQLCHPRDLEPKGEYVALNIPSDDGTIWLGRQEAGHGAYVGYPDYTLAKHGEKKELLEVRIANGDRPFGFWPRSHAIFIGVEQYADEEEAKEKSRSRTWFFDGKQKFAGWIEGRQLGDAADGDSMLFAIREGRVVTLAKDLRVRQARHFVFEGGRVAAPEKLFDDLHLGFFHRGKSLVLARWHE